MAKDYDKYLSRKALFGDKKPIECGLKLQSGSEKDEINDSLAKINNNVINLSGKTNLRQAMSILSLSKVVFGSDTGLLHIAEALGITVNMILGPTSKETGGGVNLKSSKNIEVDIWCRPCSKNGRRVTG